jgi:hypothetical protein
MKQKIINNKIIINVPEKILVNEQKNELSSALHKTVEPTIP